MTEKREFMKIGYDRSFVFRDSQGRMISSSSKAVKAKTKKVAVVKVAKVVKKSKIVKKPAVKKKAVAVKKIAKKKSVSKGRK